MPGMKKRHLVLYCALEVPLSDSKNILTGSFLGKQMGHVYLLGAGPGDPGLITVRAVECLQKADCVLFDALVNPELLIQYAPHAAHIGVRKRKGRCERTQEETTSLLIQFAREGKTVARLKGGDPISFGRGAEEAISLQQAGVPFEIVPGVSCVSAVPAYAGIPITHRAHASSFGVYSAHRQGGLTFSDAQWKSIVTGPETIVLLMGKTRCREIMTTLIRFGMCPDTPAAIIYNGSLPNQRTLVGTVKNLPHRAERILEDGPALIIIGQVVSLRQQMMWVVEQVMEREAAS
jgi:uroporphyrin-III C-methyltransferase